MRVFLELRLPDDSTDLAALIRSSQWKVLPGRTDAETAMVDAVRARITEEDRAMFRETFRFAVRRATDGLGGTLNRTADGRIQIRLIHPGDTQALIHGAGRLLERLLDRSPDIQVCAVRVWEATTKVDVVYGWVTRNGPHRHRIRWDLNAPPATSLASTEPPTFVDPALEARMGRLDPIVAAAIDAEVVEVVGSVLASRAPEVATRSDLFDLVAPWAWDLARGLHWHAIRGRRDLSADEMLPTLARGHLSAHRVRQLAPALDTAWALSYHRLIEQVHGRGSTTHRDITDLRVATPWLDAAIVGIRVHLAIELLRLSALD